MKTLYESIKSSVGIGKYALIEKLNNWFKEHPEHTRIVYNYEGEVEFAFNKESDKLPSMNIRCSHAKSIKYFSFNSMDCLNRKLIPQLKSINANGELLQIKLTRCDLDDLSELPEEADEKMEIFGSSIAIIDQLPKGVKELYFIYGHSIGGGNGCRIGEIKNIKVDVLKSEKSYGGREGLWMFISNFKNCVIDKIYLTDGMLDGWDTYKNHKISDKAQEMLNEFVKNNKVKEIYYSPRESKIELFSLSQDKKGVWHVKKA